MIQIDFGLRVELPLICTSPSPSFGGFGFGLFLVGDFARIVSVLKILKTDE